VEMSQTHRSRPLLLCYSWRLCGSPCHNPFSLVIRLCFVYFVPRELFLSALLSQDEIYYYI
jgi:hypothetical protein